MRKFVAALLLITLLSQGVSALACETDAPESEGTVAISPTGYDLPKNPPKDVKT